MNYGPTGNAPNLPKVSGYKGVSVPNLNPKQMNLLNSTLGGLGNGQQGINQGLDYLSRLAGGSDEGFQPYEAQAQRSFNQNIGQLASRFSGLGARDSSAFENAAAGAAGNLAEELAGKRHDIQSNSLNSLMSLLSRLLGIQSHDNYYMQEPEEQDTNMWNLFGQSALKSLPSILSLINKGAGTAADKALGQTTFGQENTTRSLPEILNF